MKKTVQENDKKQEYTINEKENNNRVKTFLIILCIVAIVLLCSIVVAMINKFHIGMYNNVYINNENFSNSSYDKVKAYLQDRAKSINNKQIFVTLDDVSVYTINAQDIDLSVNIEKVYNEVSKFGRTNRLINDNADIIVALIFKKDFEMDYEYSVDKFNLLVSSIANNLKDKVVDDAFKIDEENSKLVITRGKSGIDVDQEQFKKRILDAAKTNEAEVVVELPTYVRTPNNLDADVIYSSVVKDAKDASVDEKNNTYIKHEYGIGLNKENLVSLLSLPENRQEGAVITFPIDIVSPKVKLGDLKKDLYEDLISTYTTKYTTTDTSRNNNIKMSAKYINESLIMPNEEFSFNKTVGNCGLTSRGFTDATIYSGGGIATGVGGGICQTSTTLYNAVLLANLEIIQRYNHGYSVSYVPASQDATIYYPYLDLKFKNNRSYPIKIVTKYDDNGSLTISIYGTYEEKEYTIEIESVVLSTQENSTVYQNDTTLDYGLQKVKQYGKNGMKSEAYKIIKYNNQVISKTLISSDTYSPMNKIVLVGTKRDVNPYAE